MSMSYKTIFSVITEHSISTVAARYAIALAAASKADLVLYAAHEPGSHEIILRQTDRHLDSLLSLASGLNIPVTKIVEAGNICRLLPKRVQLEKADIVFYPMTLHEQQGALLGRNTHYHLQRTVPSDLAIMRVVTMARPYPGHILVPLEKHIRDNERRLLFVSELAKSYHAQVTLFHLTAERVMSDMPDDITAFRKQLQLRNVTTLERRGSGKISAAIAVEALTRHNDLVILGTSGRGIVRRIFFGNPSGDIMQQPPCNTILFRAAH
jgi:nucleotide-binding universal stress UspA family protein